MTTRVIGAVFIAIAAGPAHRSGYLDLATAWDGDWYRAIATSGYPSPLPVDADGQVGQSAWAFSPGYPMLVRGLMALTGLGFSVVATTVSLVLGAAAMVVLFVLVERAVSRFTACACVVLSCTFMAAPVMQLSYSESLALLLLVGALFLLRERKYLAVGALLLMLALTRPVVLAFIPVLVVHGVSRWRGRAADPFTPKDQRAVTALTLWCVAASVSWPLIVGIFTHDLFAWTKTQDSWRPTGSFGPAIGWPAYFLHTYGWSGLAILTLVVLLTLRIVLRPASRAWGPEIRCWSVAYPLYLLLVSAPVPSAVRWLLLAFPLMWPFPEDAATSSERRFQIALIALVAVVGLGMQWVWVSTFLASVAPSIQYP